MADRQIVQLKRARTRGAEPLVSRFRLRNLAIAFGIEFPYAILVPFAYLWMVGASVLELPAHVFVALGLIYVVKTLLLGALLIRLLRPVERWRRSMEVPGCGLSDGLICEAGRVAYRAPATFAIVWSLAWGLASLVLTPLLHRVAPGSIVFGSHAVSVTLLFAYACSAAAIPLAYGILGWLLAPEAGAISLVARDRGLIIPGHTLSFGSRLVVLSWCLATAPTSWMAAMILARTPSPMPPDASITLLLFAFVAVSWTPMCAVFVLRAVAHPLRRVAAVIDQIIHRGDVERLERVPILIKDEIGALAEGVNTMVDRLQESAARIGNYLAERERLLEEEARRAAQLQAILDNVVEGVFAYDASGNLTRVNASGLRLLGLDGHEGGREVEGAPPIQPAALDWRHADGTPYAYEQLPMVRALCGETIVQETQILRHPRSGRDLFLRTSAAPIRTSGGAIVGAVAVARDVSEVLQLDQMKDHFIRVAAHELKTPVTIMKGYALGLLRGASDLPERHRKMLSAIDRGADRITSIVDDLLDVSQAFLGRFKITVERFDLQLLLDEEIGRAARRTQRHHIRRVGHVGAPMMVRGDAQRLRQVLGRLIGNAITYSPSGGDIEVSLELRPAPGGEVMEAVVAVSDHGVGIPVEKQTHIFQLFYRAHTDTAHDYGGMGVGLYVSKHLVAQQGGRIWFESEEGKGSTFYFSLPQA